jgi:hypothetical protein
MGSLLCQLKLEPPGRTRPARSLLLADSALFYVAAVGQVFKAYLNQGGRNNKLGRQSHLSAISPFPSFQSPRMPHADVQPVWRTTKHASPSNDGQREAASVTSLGYLRALGGAGSFAPEQFYPLGPGPLIQVPRTCPARTTGPPLHDRPPQHLGLASKQTDPCR